MIAVDFAIFNWLAEKHTEAYVRAEVNLGDGRAGDVTGHRFYRFSHSIDSICDKQPLCSGAVQWWNRTPAAYALLEQWQRITEGTPGSADDKCLDHAFNNCPAEAPPTRTLHRLSNQVWLPVARFSSPLWL